MIIYDHGNRNNNKIALTFDDGPNPFWMPKILNILDEYSIKANFFVLGKWAKVYSNLLKETFNRGHIIGNHSYSHPKTGFADFEKADEIIFSVIKTPAEFIRPPYFDVSLCDGYKPAIAGKVKIINADVVSGDWKNKADEILDLVLKNVQNGSIINFHDGSYKEWEIENRPAEMVKILPEMIEKLSQNFKIARLDDFYF